MLNAKKKQVLAQQLLILTVTQSLTFHCVTRSDSAYIRIMSHWKQQASLNM